MKTTLPKKVVKPHLVKYLVPGGITLIALLVMVAPQIQLLVHPKATPHTTTPTTVVQVTPAPATPAPAPTTPKVTPPTPKATPKTTTPVIKPAPVVVPSPASSVDSLVPTTTTTVPDSSSPTGGTTTAVSYSSTNWAGYMATNATFTSVSGSWIVPTATGNGTSMSADATWIGIGGVSSGDLIQTGTLNIVSASGQVSTSAFYEMLPAASVNIPTMVVAAGDSMSATIVELSTNHWSITITNNTTVQTFTKLATYTSSHSSAEWIEEDPSTSHNHLFPLNNFGVAAFSNSAMVANGSTLNLASAGAKLITLVNSGGTPLATTSAIKVDGSSFTVTHN